MMLVHLSVLVLVAAVCWVALSLRRPPGDGRVRRSEPKMLLAVTLLYAIPLPVALMMGSEGGNLSHDLNLFAPWLPEALWFTAAFMAVFTVTYHFIDRGRVDARWMRLDRLDRPLFRAVSLCILALCLLMLQVLAADVGGLVSLVLSGYHVTELFVGKGHLAVAIEWLVALSVVAMSYGIVSRNTGTLKFAAAAMAVMILMLAVMGRRGMLVTVLLSMTYLALEAGWIRRPARMLLPGLLGFVALNWLGLVRGESYGDISDLAFTLIAKTNDLSEAGELLTGTFYTLTHGNFVVPFETLPQLMRRLEQSPDYWLGASIPRGLLLLAPNVLVPDRPLPLANWYMEAFYGGADGLNEGRQFFFLSEAYLNFGWLGAVAWGVGVAWLFQKLARPRAGAVTYWGLALRALFFGSMLNFAASDTTGFVVAFFKGLGLVPLVFFAAHAWTIPKTTRRRLGCS